MSQREVTMRIRKCFEPFFVMTNDMCFLNVSDSLWIYFLLSKMQGIFLLSGKIQYGTFTPNIIPCFVKTHSENQD